MSILVTGVNGMTGLHTAKILLDNDYDVVGYDNCRSGELAYYPEVEEKIIFVWGDMTHAGHGFKRFDCGLYQQPAPAPKNYFKIILSVPGGVTKWLKMLTYCVYAPLFNPFVPCQKP